MKVTVYTYLQEVEIKRLKTTGCLKPQAEKWVEIYEYYKAELAGNGILKDKVMVSVSNTADHYALSDRQIFTIIDKMEKEL